MASPFPGMDPYLEGSEWEDFHARFIQAIAADLEEQVLPRYIVRSEKRVYLEHVASGLERSVRPDVVVLEPVGAGAGAGRRSAAQSPPEPATLTLPMPEEVEEAYLTVRRAETHEVVSVIELLSPGNKRRGGAGQRAYLDKRDQILCSPIHLVELDLLRGGERLLTDQELPPGDYYVFVSRARRRPRVEVYAWSVQQPMPVVPVPLSAGDADAHLDLQALFTEVYNHARYDLSLNYQRPLEF